MKLKITTKRPGPSPADTIRSRADTVNEISRKTWSPSKFQKMKRLPLSNVMLSVSGIEDLDALDGASKSPVTLDRLVNNKTFADIAFAVGSHLIYAHRSIIEARGPNMLTLHLKEKASKKGNLTTYTLDEKFCDENILYIILTYLYTDTIQLSSLSPIDIVNIIKTSEAYNIERLIWLCERHLRLVINNDLFFELLNMAYNFHIEHVKTVCFQYAQKHFNTLILMKEGIHSIGINLFLDMIVISKYDTSSIENVVNSMPSTMISDMQHLFEKKQDGDGRLVFCDEEVKFHRGVLQAQSEKAIDLIRSKDEVASKENEIYNIQASSFEAALTFFYYRNKLILPQAAAELLPLCHKYDFVELYEECESIVLREVNEVTAVLILRLCYHDEIGPLVKDKLYNKCFEFILANFSHIQFDYEMPSLMSKDIIKGLQHLASGVHSKIPEIEKKPSSKTLDTSTNEKMASLHVEEMNTSEALSSDLESQTAELDITEERVENNFANTRVPQIKDPFYESSDSANIISTDETHETHPASSKSTKQSRKDRKKKEKKSKRKVRK